MINPLAFKTSVANNKKIEEEISQNNSPNPLRLKANLSSLAAISNYNQVLTKPKFDKDTASIKNKVSTMLKQTPSKLDLPYSFRTDEINGERVYDKEGILKFIKEYKNDTIIEYYPAENKEYIKTILEKNKNGEIVSKIQRVLQNNKSFKTNIIIFDEKFNNKYTMFQVEEDGSINSITEIYNDSKNFRTLIFKNYNPDRYIESKENNKGDFEITDCRFGINLEVKEIKQITPEKEVYITYSGNKKVIEVRRKFQEE